MYVRQWAVCRWNYPLQSVLLSMHTQCMYIYQARDVESHLEYVTNFFFFVVNFCVIFNYNLGENSQTPFTIRNNPPNHYVDKLPNSFRTPTQHPMRDELLVMYFKVN